MKLRKPVFGSGLIVTMEDQGNNFIVYLHDTHHNKQLNIKKYPSYDKAYNNFKTRCLGL